MLGGLRLLVWNDALWRRQADASTRAAASFAGDVQARLFSAGHLASFHARADDTTPKLATASKPRLTPCGAVLVSVGIELNRREIPGRISQARLTVDLGALPGVPALRAKAKAQDTSLGMTRNPLRPIGIRQQSATENFEAGGRPNAKYVCRAQHAVLLQMQKLESISFLG